MTISHHPDALTLLSHAAGSLAEPLAAVVAAHLSLCPTCRAELTDMEGLGMALMRADTVAHATDAGVGGAPPAPPPHAASATSTAMADAGRARARPAVGDPVAASVAAAGRSPELPDPLRRRWDNSLADIRWYRLARGIWHHRLPLSPAAAGELRLLKVAGGFAIPDHGHAGAELTLVIDGGFEDVTGHYLAGDVQDVGTEIEHRPRADAEGCICLVASDGPIRFSSLGLRLVQGWRRI